LKEYYSITREDALKRLDTDAKNGLTLEEGKKRLNEFGENKLLGKTEKSLFMLFLEQMKEFLVIILILASIASIALGETVDGVAIISIVLLNGILGVYQENKASNALKALKEMASPFSKVLRETVWREINSAELVPGDIIQLDAGDNVPADVRLIESMTMKIDESALTGESVPVEKKAAAVLAEDTSLGDRANCAFMGSVVTYGRGKALVTGTAMNTEMGKIAKMLNETEEGETPLQTKLNALGKLLGIACLAICAVIFGLGMLQKDPPLELFMTAVSLAVAAVPEGLTVVVTVILALGMQRMVKSNAIIKKLSACETLGSTTVICSDKTGTLTQNKMTVVSVYDNSRLYNVTGSGYSYEGEITSEDDEPVGVGVEKTLTCAALCNDASYNESENLIIGDPTEGSLLVAARKIGLSKLTLEKNMRRIGEIPFDSDRKLMSTFHKLPDGGTLMFTKGAPDEILRRATFIYVDGETRPITQEEKRRIAHANADYAKNALRVLGMACREVDEPSESVEIENDLIILGLVGMIDPPRDEAKDAVAVCKRAGIEVKMITGDHKITASAIGRELGIIDDDISQSAEGRELDSLSDEALREKVKSTNVFARVSPEHKVRIITAIKDNGEIAAMTGDGVNDAPSLKKADIGVAMGITGTDVSKEAADMILTDDNFASIVLAVSEGRTIYNNIRKVVSFLLSCNIGEILLIFTAMLLNLPVPLAPIQLLMINLITDAFPAFALGMEAAEKDVMDAAPRDPNEPVVNKKMAVAICIQSVFLAASTLASFIIARRHYGDEIASTVCFLTLVLGELFRAYSSRSEHQTIFKMPIASNAYLNKTVIISTLFVFATIYIPFLHPIFNTSFLPIAAIGLCALCASLPLVGGEAAKLITKRI
jgi:Ca2+-transporting ATPase